MRTHLHVVRRHIDNIFKTAPSRFQNHAQVFPARDELRLGIGDDFKINGAPDLPSAENYRTSLHGRYITGALYDTCIVGGMINSWTVMCLTRYRIEAVIHRKERASAIS